jgi:hypothetical protein
VLTETPPEQGSSSEDPLDLTDVTPKQLKGVAGEAKTQVTVTLYWSEYYHGKWQPARTSDVNKPLALGDFPPSGSGAFDRTLLRLRSSKENPNELLVHVSYEASEDHFKLYDTHGLPVRAQDDSFEPALDISPIGQLPRSRSFAEAPEPFGITYFDPWAPAAEWTDERQVLGKGTLYEIVDPRHPVTEVFKAPFFLQDPRHVFFVTSRTSLVLVGEYLPIGISRPPLIAHAGLTLLVQPDYAWLPAKTLLLTDPGRPGVVDPSPVESFLKRDRHIHRAIGTTGTLSYGDRLIGPGGSVALGKNIR